MRIDKAIEKIVLTEQEAEILEMAYEIAMNISNESETIASDYAETVTDALSDLISEGENDNSEYAIGYEKTVNKKAVFITIEI